MLLCRRLSPIANRAHRIHYRTFFSQQILKQEEVTTPGDRSVPADQDTPDTHPAGTLEPKNTSYSASSTIATSYDKMRQNDPKVALHQISDPYFEKISYAAKNNDYHRIRTLVSKLILAKQEDEITRATKLRYTLLSVSLDKLPPNMVVSMLRMITKLLGPEYHSRKVINRIIPIILDLPPNAARQIVDLVYPSLLYNLQHIRHKKKNPPDDSTPISLYCHFIYSSSLASTSFSRKKRGIAQNPCRYGAYSFISTPRQKCYVWDFTQFVYIFH